MRTVEFHDTSFAYPGRATLALDHVVAQLPEGDIVLVLGTSGSGKSTLLRAVNGIVPHHTGGRFSGDVRTAGISTRTTLPRDLARHVGFVHQDPEAQFVTDRVESDVAFALENLGFDATAMRRRVEEVFDALGIAALRDRHPGTLSGGEQQRCAIAGAIAAGPSILVLDEPTSQIDPQGAEQVLAALTRLNQELGTTVVIAEHRLERVAPIADRAITVAHGSVGATADVARTLAQYHGAPSIVQLGVALGWDPIPLTVRDARRALAKTPLTLTETQPTAPSPGELTVRARGIAQTYDGRVALHPTDLDLHVGEIIVLLGRNGAGKSTLLRALAGLEHNRRGRVDAGGRIAYVPQDPNTLLFAATVRAELESTLSLLGQTDSDGRVDRWLDALDLLDIADAHPRDLSGGQRQRVAVAAVAVGDATTLLLDEPTRGMDAPSRSALETAIRSHAARGGTVVLATHDVELAARVAHRAIVLADGERIADGPAHDVLGGSLFAPQVARVLPGFLTVDAVLATSNECHA